MNPEQVRAAVAAANQEGGGQEELPEGDYELAPDDWRAWTVFLACQRAWRVVSGLGGVYHDGIDPSAVRSTVDLLRIKPKHWPDVLWRLQVLESEARKFLNKPPET